MRQTQAETRPLSRVVYTPESLLRHPGRLFRSMARGLLTSRELAWRLFIRNLNAQYRQTVLGYFWAFLPPIVTTLTFVYLNSQQIIQVNDTDIPYPVYVMVGTLLWQGFVDALNSPIKLINSSKAMLAKINFPREALLLAGVGEVLFNFVIRLSLLAVVFFWFRVRLPATALLAPLGLMALFGLGLMIGILLAPFSVLYQDVERGLTVFIGMWLLVTPVAYSLPSQGTIARLVQLNPVSPLLVTTRELLTTGVVSQPERFVIVTGITFMLLLFGWLLYRLAMPHIIERMSAS